MKPCTMFFSFQVGRESICNYEYVVYIHNETVAYATEPLPLLSGSRLEFTVSTVASGLAYDSKYQMTIEGNGLFLRHQLYFHLVSTLTLLVASFPLYNCAQCCGNSNY